MSRIDMSAETRAEYDLLCLANENGKFAIQFDIDDTQAQEALERLQIRRWVTLIDFTHRLEAGRGRLMRIYLASEDALTWLRTVRGDHDDA